MRKVTKRLLAACVAVLAVSACQDSPLIVTPAPPPPPPPPPGIDATVTIQGLRTIPGNAPVNPTGVAGDINVVLNVEEGDNTVTGVDLLFNGAPIGCATVTANVAPGAGVSLNTTGASDVVECFWNTDDVLGACVGEQLDPAFGNGTHSLGAQITLSDGTTRTANNVQTVTLVNGDFIMVTHVGGGQGVIGTNGRLYYGGPDPLPDATANTVEFGACPVSFNDTVVGTLSVVSTSTSAGASQDFGSGPGVAHTDAATPFVFVPDPDDNIGVEDDPVVGTGQTVMSTGSIFDDNGLNVTTQFAHGTLMSMWMDFTPPVVAAGAEITVGGAVVAGGEHFSAGAFGVTGVTDGGVGFTFGAGAGSQVDVGDCAEADNTDNDFTTDFDPEFSDVSSIDDLLEDDPLLDADTNALDCYVGEVVLLQDDLSNATDLDALVDAINTGDPPTFHGVDRNGPENTNPLPAMALILNPDADDNGCMDVGDCTLMFDSEDPDLESGDAGSLLDDVGCSLAGGCTAMTATVSTGPAGSSATLPLNECDGAIGQVGLVCSDELVDPDFSVELFGEPDGDYVVDVDMQDLATPNNVTTISFTFTLDDTAPGFGALNPAPVGSAGTDASAIVMTIGGSISDANIIDSAVLSVFDNVAGVCGDGDDVLLDVGAAAGEVDQNEVDLTNATEAITFNESFTIQQPSAAAVTVDYCFVIDAEDEAVLKDGTDTGNMSSLSTIVAVTWNAG